MKQEEQILRALGNVKDRFLLEVSGYMDDPRKEVLVQPKKKHGGFVGLAAAAALMVTGSLSLYAVTGGQRLDASLTASIQVSSGILRQIVCVTPEMEEDYRPIREIQVYDGDTLTQTINEKDLPSLVEDYNEGLFINLAQPLGQPDFRDVNFDGYEDLGILAVSEYPENVPYNYFLWNPERSRFEYGFTLYGATALEVDESRQLLIETVAKNGQQTQRYYSFSNGAIHSVTPEEASPTAAWPAFRIDYDSALLSMTENDEGFFLSPIDYADYLPPCDIQIEFLPGLLPYAAMEKTKAELTDGLLSLDWEPATGVYTFHIAPEEAVWNAQVRDVWIVGAGSYGSYRLTARYFMEAAEGWGMTFPQICTSFTCPLSESPNAEAEQAIISFADGYFSGNQLLMLSNYYGDSDNLKDVYTQNASLVRLVALRGLEELDARIQENGSAAVSLVFLESETDDSYTYLSMDVMKTQAGYRVCFHGLEK